MPAPDNLLMTWNEAVEDPTLEGLPYKIELNRDGNIIMSPTRNPHGIRQCGIGSLLTRLRPDGLAATEMAIQTSDNVKVTDVAWFTREQARVIAAEDVCSKAPTICVEIASKSNYQRELDERKALYFEAGAREVWFCDRVGKMIFHTPEGQVATSPLCPDLSRDNPRNGVRKVTPQPTPLRACRAGVRARARGR